MASFDLEFTSFKPESMTGATERMENNKTELQHCQSRFSRVQARSSVAHLGQAGTPWKPERINPTVSVIFQSCSSASESRSVCVNYGDCWEV